MPGFLRLKSWLRVDAGEVTQRQLLSTAPQLRPSCPKPAAAVRGLFFFSLFGLVWRETKGKPIMLAAPPIFILTHTHTPVLLHGALSCAAQTRFMAWPD